MSDYKAQLRDMKFVLQEFAGVAFRLGIALWDRIPATEYPALIQDTDFLCTRKDAEFLAKEIFYVPA